MSKQSDRRPWLAPLFKVAAVVVLVSFAVWVNLRVGELDSLRQTVMALGYPGLLGASVLSGFNLLVPVPVVAFFPVLLESGFRPAPALATIAIGMTAGDFLGYLIGDASRDLAGDRLQGLRAKVDDLHRRHPVLPLLLLFLYAAFAPIPNELLVIPLAFMGYSLIAVMVAVLLGNVVFNTLAAYGVSVLFSGA